MAAFTITSKQEHTQSDLKSLFEFLIDFKNFESILPHDKIENFKVLDNGCSFVIKGITPMSIKIADQKAFDYILFSSEGLAKFNFSLKALFIGEPTKDGECRIELSGDLNPFIKSMAEKPLAGLIDTMSLKLSQLKLT